MEAGEASRKEADPGKSVQKPRLESKAGTECEARL